MRLGYAQQEVVIGMEAQADQIGKMIRNLQKALRAKLSNDDNPEVP
jgi:hypothetical protein